MKKIHIINNMTESSFDEENDPADNLDFELDLTPDGIEYMKYSDNLDFEERKNHFNIIEDRQNIINYKNNSNINYCVDKDGVLHYYNGKKYRIISIPNNVITIGEGAFEKRVDIEKITIPDSVTSIEFWAFLECSGLESVKIPKSVTNIDYGAFDGCSGLQSIIVKEGNPIYDSRNCCNAIIETATNKLILGCKNTTIPNSVTSIGNSAFDSCSSLRSIVIPEGVTSIGDHAFSGCSSLESIIIPNSVTSIGAYAFDGCSGLQSIIVDEGNPIYDSRNRCNAIIETATNKLILGCKNTTIPNSVTSIGNSAFNSCRSLTSIVIPEGVISIGANAFSRCSSLESIIVPNSVTSIGNNAFYNCRSLTSIVIPEGVISIGANAFSRCSSLESIIIPNSLTSIGTDAFDECKSLKYNEYDDCLYLGNKINPFIILAKVKSIEITSCIVNKNIKLISSTAFKGCCNISYIVVDEGNPIYDSRNCCNAIIETATNKLILGCKNTTIPNSVTSIGNSAFNSCSSLTSIVIPEGVISIGANAFSRCSSLESIIIPKSVTSIGYSIFEGCELLKNVFIYSKSFADLMNMKIDILSNEKMLQVICFYSELEPTVEGRFWHYVNGEPVEYE